MKLPFDDLETKKQKQKTKQKSILAWPNRRDISFSVSDDDDDGKYGGDSSFFTISEP